MARPFKVSQAKTDSKSILRLLLLAAIWAAAWFGLHGELYQAFLNDRLSASNAFIAGLVISFLTIAVFEIVFFFLLVKTQHITNFRQYFKIERLDVPGIWLCVGLGLALQVLNGIFLGNYVLKPMHDFLAFHGLTGAGIGLSSGNVVPALSSGQAIFLTVFLLLFWWLEFPEELFFRGYVQNQLQPITGKNMAVLLSATIWALAHVFSLVNILETFLYGLVFALVFRFRQNCIPTALVHPVSNRSLLLAVTIPQIWGWQVPASGSTGLLLLVGIYMTLLVVIIQLWKHIQPNTG